LADVDLQKLRDLVNVCQAVSFRGIQQVIEQGNANGLGMDGIPSADGGGRIEYSM